MERFGQVIDYMDDDLEVTESVQPKQTQASEVVKLIWPAPSLDWMLRSGEVHVWSISLEQPKHQLKALAATLSADEQGRAARLRFENIRERWIAGRGLLRQILGYYVGCDPSEVCFEYGPNGKPVFPGSDHALHFNFSHSGNLALCAISDEQAVGVDIEKICFIAEAAPIALRCFSREEQIEYDCATLEEKQRMFYRIWTRKEAVLKWNGRGIGNMEETLSQETAFTGFFQELVPAPGYIGCLAIEKRSKAVQLWQWT